MAGKDKYLVEIVFDGVFTLEIEAENFTDLGERFENEKAEITSENIEEAIRLEIGKAEINSKLEIGDPWIRKVEFA